MSLTKFTIARLATTERNLLAGGVLKYGDRIEVQDTGRDPAALPT